VDRQTDRHTDYNTLHPTGGELTAAATATDVVLHADRQTDEQTDTMIKILLMLFGFLLQEFGIHYLSVFVKLRQLPTFRRHLKTFHFQSAHPLSAAHLA